MKAFKVFILLSYFLLVLMGLSLCYAQPFDLTGFWQNPGGSAVYRVRQIGNSVYWSVDGTSMGSYANVFIGELSGNTLSGTWVDLPGSPNLGGGNLTLQIQSNDYFFKVAESTLYAAQEWVRQGSSGGVGGLPPTQQNMVPLKLYWNAEREDNFSTSTTVGEQDALANGYQLIGIEGYVFSNQEPGTVPLKLYWNAQRSDYFTTATPQGEQDALGSGYEFIRVEGYVLQSETQQQGIVPLKLFWHGGRGDNSTTALPGSEQGAYAAGYQFVRFEGYVIP